MSLGKRIPLSRARDLAKAIVADLAPGCERIEIAGSIRRRRPDVGDIEIVAIPFVAADLFGDVGGQPVGTKEKARNVREHLGIAGQSMLDPLLTKQIEEGLFKKKKWGPAWKQFVLPHSGDLQLDLFLCTPATWGVTLAIRTGPADFSQKLVTMKQQGGLCPSHLCFRDWRIRTRAGQPVKWHDTPEEKDVFDVLGMKWIEPWER